MPTGFLFVPRIPGRLNVLCCTRATTDIDLAHHIRPEYKARKFPPPVSERNILRSQSCDCPKVGPISSVVRMGNFRSLFAGNVVAGNVVAKSTIAVTLISRFRRSPSRIVIANL